ncbi:hypothetical protein IAD21_03737 [Abditibacteriota bacterium]|nr:hypothetical protein IAD21_03737 [Abditibacteriota bacterium]
MWKNEQNPNEIVVTQVAPVLFGIGTWLCDPSVLHPQYNQLMACDLYRLGIKKRTCWQN